MTTDSWTRNVSKFALVVLLVVLLYDAYLTSISSNDTLSNVISSANAQTGGLIALAIAALWIHWFVPLPDSWISQANRQETP
jgi:hypothetical protein